MENIERCDKLIGKRNEKGYSQEYMSKLLGISKNNYFEKENGKKQFKKNEIDKILRILNDTYENIFFTIDVTEKSYNLKE